MQNRLFVFLSLYLCAMSKTIIHFFKEGVRFRLQNQEPLKEWIESAFKKNKIKVESISYIFSSDKYLLKLNKDFLQHNYFTDIITFDNSNQKGKVEADIFISIDRVSANAKNFDTTFQNELHRVMIHGALHLMGYKDKTAPDKKKMRAAEEFWLKKRNF